MVIFVTAASLAAGDDRLSMTVQSYLVYPQPGRIDDVRCALSSTPGCEVVTADNRDLLVLVTESADEREQNELEEKLESLAGVDCLALVSGWTE